VRLWNGTTRQTTTSVSLDGVCLGLAFSGDGGTLIILSAQHPDNQLTLWRLADEKKLAHYSIPQTGPATPFVVARDLSVAAHATEENKVRMIELATGKERWKAKAADDFVLSIALSPDGKLLASGEGFTDSVIRLWDVASGVEIGHLEGHRAGVGRLLFWPDGKTLASGSFDQTIRLWDVSDPAKGRPLSTLRGNTGA